MIKFLLVLLLVGTSLASLAKKDCMTELSQTAETLRTVLKMDLSNKKIDAITEMINGMPQTIGDCLGESYK